MTHQLWEPRPKVAASRIVGGEVSDFSTVAIRFGAMHQALLIHGSRPTVLVLGRSGPLVRFVLFS
jgi:hypothetical protein